MKRILSIVILLWLVIPGWGQYYNAGQAPSSLKWRQIRTENFQLIYPEHYEPKAQELANKLEGVCVHVQKTLDKKARPVSVILQTETTVSNGFVSWAPSRSEFEVTPPQDHDIVEWLDILAIHEYRHVVQINQLNVGLTRVMSFMFGEQGVGLSLVMTMPLWFLEGDATLTETLLSQGGRGRIPQFTCQMRTLKLSGYDFSYPKAMFGSYKDFVPNHYNLGYHMVASARKRYGAMVWDSTLTSIGRFPFRPYPFSRALKKQTGESTQELYERTMQEVLERNEAVKPSHITPADVIRANEGTVPLKYMFPQALANGNLVMLKSGYDVIPQLIEVAPDGSEKLLCFTGPYFQHTLNVGGNNITWAELRYDPRWERRNYSVLMVFDEHTGKKRQVTHRSRLFAPDITKDGEQLIAVEMNEKGESALVLLAAEGGEERFRFPTKPGFVYRHPRWNTDGKGFVCIAFDGEANNLIEWNFVEGEWRQKKLLGAIREQVYYPQRAGEEVYYAASYNGIDNIYCFQEGLGVHQVTSRPYGAFYPSLSDDGTTLYFSDYQQTGYRAMSMPLAIDAFVPMDSVVYQAAKFYGGLEQQEFGGDITHTFPDSQYVSKRYPKVRNLFRVHSWTPAPRNFQDNFFQDIEIHLMSQNNLSTLTSGIDFQQSLVSDFTSMEVEMNWEGWYPKIGVEAFQQNFNGLMVIADAGDTLRTDRVLRGAGLTMELPLVLTKSHWNQFVNLRGNVEITELDYSNEEETQLEDRQQVPVTLQGAYQLTLRRAKRDLMPRCGVALSGGWGSTPFRMGGRGKFLYGRSHVWLPGLLKHHHVRLENSYEYRNAVGNIFRQITRMPYGYGLLNGVKEAYFVGLSYHFPFLYPDWNLELVYIQRLKASFFAETTWLDMDGEGIERYDSYGLTVRGDINWFKYAPEIDLGLRAGYALQADQPWFVSVLFDYSI